MTLWRLLLLCCLVAPCAGALAALRTYEGGVAGWLLALLTVGAMTSFTLVLHRYAVVYGDELLQLPESRSVEWRLRVLYGLAITWWLASGLIADYLVSRALVLVA